MKQILFGLLLGLACASPAFAGDTHYVVKDNSGAGSPFTNWTTAASNIQQAIDEPLCVAGDMVLVSNGVYDVGGITNISGGPLTNRVAVTKAITVKAFSTNWADTVIKGAPDPVSGENGDAAIRAVFLTNGATLVGFTITNGCTTQSGSGVGCRGGGVYCYGTGAVISNCLIICNKACYGAGFANGTVVNSMITSNYARFNAASVSGAGGGGYGFDTAATTVMMKNCVVSNNYGHTGGSGFYGWGTLINCTFVYNRTRNDAATAQGGGINGDNANTVVSNCVVMYNYAYNYGGGVYGAKTYGSLIANNRTSSGGGGGYYGVNAVGIINCTIVSNRSNTGPGGISTTPYVTNCIVYSNYTGTAISNYNTTCPIWSYSCTWPMPTSGVGNIVNEPAFADFAGKDYRLSPNSPCINKGTNQGWMNTAVDLDGRRRIIEGTVDIGAYEFLHRGTIVSIH